MKLRLLGYFDKYFGDDVMSVPNSASYSTILSAETICD